MKENQENKTETKKSIFKKPISENEINEIEHLFNTIAESNRLTLGQALELGAALANVKSVTKHGCWGRWVRDVLKKNERTVQRYLKLNKYRDEFEKNDTVSDFVSAYRLCNKLDRDAKAARKAAALNAEEVVAPEAGEPAVHDQIPPVVFKVLPAPAPPLGMAEFSVVDIDETEATEETVEVEVTE